MTTRTVQMYGKAYGNNVSLTASFNNVQFVNGTITSVDSDADLDIVFDDMDVISTFSLDSSVSGNVPFTATVTGGSFVFHTFHADYCGNIYTVDGNGDATLQTASANNVRDISFAATSPDTGHNNIVVAGESRTRDLSTFPDATGIWNWTIYDGETLSMNIEVSTVSSN